MPYIYKEFLMFHYLNIWFRKLYFQYGRNTNVTIPWENLFKCDIILYSSQKECHNEQYAFQASSSFCSVVPDIVEKIDVVNRSLCSSNSGSHVPNSTKTWGEWAFAHAGPTLWNNLPLAIKNSMSPVS